MELKVFQKGFNYSQDGPGNRLVYHLRGCNMSCPWCANPEGLNPSGKGTKVSEIIDEAIRSKRLFFDGGGVTFTGGEPTVQFDALKETLKELKGNGIDTAIETNASSARMPELFLYLDHIMMDLKHSNSSEHKLITGVPLDSVISNIKAAVSECKDVLIHIPLVNGYNTSPSVIKGFAEILYPFRERIKVEPLYYHEYGVKKWEELSLEYKVNDGKVKEETKEIFYEVMKAHGITLVRT